MALLLVALMPASASADPKFDNGCRAQLTGEEGGNEAELTFRCADFEVQDVELQGNKDFVVFPLAPDGFICAPVPEPGRSATCGGPGADAATIQILAQDACGTEDNRPLVLDVLLVGEEPETQTADIEELQIQCEEEPPDDGNGDGDGTGGGGDDDGATPQGGVDSGAGGTADTGVSDELLPAGIGLILVGALGFGTLALVRRRA